MPSKLYSAPATEPVTLAEVKAFCRIDNSYEDALINTLITGARQAVEAYTHRALITQTWDLWADSWGSGWPDPDAIAVDQATGFAYTGWTGQTASLELPYPPLQSVSTVYYYKDDDVQQTFSSANYIVDTVREPGRVALKRGQIWPAGLRPVNGVQVRYVAGYGAASAVPAAIRQGILQLIADWYDNRGGYVVGQAVNDLPNAVQRLLDPYRVQRLF